MKRTTLALFSAFAAGLVALASPANAQEPPKWQGLYAGFYTGWIGIDDDYSSSVLASPGNMDIDGWLNGLVGGYNYRHGNWLFGVEVDGAIVDAGDEPDACVGTPCRLDMDNLGTFRARVGWIFGEEDQYAAYITGGYATSGWEWNDIADREHFTRHGYVVGAGLEAYLFNTNWISNKIEFNYIGFSGGDEALATGSVSQVFYDPDGAFLLKFGLNLHF